MATDKELSIEEYIEQFYKIELEALPLLLEPPLIFRLEEGE